MSLKVPQQTVTSVAVQLQQHCITSHPVSQAPGNQSRNMDLFRTSAALASANNSAHGTSHWQRRSQASLSCVVSTSHLLAGVAEKISFLAKRYSEPDLLLTCSKAWPLHTPWHAWRCLTDSCERRDLAHSPWQLHMNI